MSPGLEAVEEVLTTYFDGLYLSDTERLGQVFHPKAIYVCATESPLVYRTMEEYLPIVAARLSPAIQGQVRRDRIVSVEFAGENTAFARVECAIGPRFFIDFLTLIFVEGRWQIISKVFEFVQEPS